MDLLDCPVKIIYQTPFPIIMPDTRDLQEFDISPELEVRCCIHKYLFPVFKITFNMSSFTYTCLTFVSKDLVIMFSNMEVDPLTSDPDLNIIVAHHGKLVVRLLELQRLAPKIIWETDSGSNDYRPWLTSDVSLLIVILCFFLLIGT